MMPINIRKKDYNRKMMKRDYKRCLTSNWEIGGMMPLNMNSELIEGEEISVVHMDKTCLATGIWF